MPVVTEKSRVVGSGGREGSVEFSLQKQVLDSIGVYAAVEAGRHVTHGMKLGNPFMVAGNWSDVETTLGGMSPSAVNIIRGAAAAFDVLKRDRGDAATTLTGKCRKALALKPTPGEAVEVDVTHESNSLMGLDEVANLKYLGQMVTLEASRSGRAVTPLFQSAQTWRQVQDELMAIPTNGPAGGLALIEGFSATMGELNPGYKPVGSRIASIAGGIMKARKEAELGQQGEKTGMQVALPPARTFVDERTVPDRIAVDGRGAVYDRFNQEYVQAPRLLQFNRECESRGIALGVSIEIGQAEKFAPVLSSVLDIFPPKLAGASVEQLSLGGRPPVGFDRVGGFDGETKLSVVSDYNFQTGGNPIDSRKKMEVAFAFLHEFGEGVWHHLSQSTNPAIQKSVRALEAGESVLGANTGAMCRRPEEEGMFSGAGPISMGGACHFFIENMKYYLFYPQELAAHVEKLRRQGSPLAPLYDETIGLFQKAIGSNQDPAFRKKVERAQQEIQIV
ncbi:MAG: hypothetical protein FJY77_00285 [Candidatus Altiarchaeales archaeon]|nr:hypothetical protein [Candidatus Altiarchaeales archaeon]